MFVSLIVALMCGARAANAAEAEIERMTWIEVRDRIAAGDKTVIIPTGGTEQNGAHMVTGKHNFIVAETARRIVAGLGHGLVAPVIAYVPEGDAETRTGHMAYAGSITVPEPVYKALLKAAAESMKAHGFTSIVFLGDSGGNQAMQEELSNELSAAWAADGVKVINARAYYADNGGEAMLLYEGETKETIGTHAGIYDTSELLAVYPAGVRLEGAKPDSDGATGDPRRATRERGEKLIDLKVAAAVAEIKAAEDKRTVIVKAEAMAPSTGGVLAWLRHLIFG